jgi:hypothetical protein
MRFASYFSIRKKELFLGRFELQGVEGETGSPLQWESAAELSIAYHSRWRGAAPILPLKAVRRENRRSGWQTLMRLAVGVVGAESVKFDAVLAVGFQESPSLTFAQVEQRDLPFAARGTASDEAGSVGH